MIASLHGIVESIRGSTAVLNVNGVGYEVWCSRRCLEGLVRGGDASVIVYTEVKEDGIRLYGFLDTLEKQVFLLLLKVKGVGARSGADIVSQIEGRDLLRMIGSGNTAALQRVKGVGRKTAERIVVELRDRVVEYLSELGTPPAAETQQTRSTTPPFPDDDALGALCALGFQRREAENALDRARKSFEQASDSVNRVDVGELVKEALKYV